MWRVHPEVEGMGVGGFKIIRKGYRDDEWHDLLDKERERQKMLTVVGQIIKENHLVEVNIKDSFMFEILILMVKKMVGWLMFRRTIIHFRHRTGCILVGKMYTCLKWKRIEGFRIEDFNKEEREFSI